MKANARSFLSAVLAATLFACAGNVTAGPRLNIEGAFEESGKLEVNRYGVLFSFDVVKEWLRTGNWYLTIYQEVGVHYWDGSAGTSGNDSLVEFQMTPVFRWQRDVSTGLGLFIEVGSGIRVYTDHEIDDRDFDIPFSFGSHFGAGSRFGAKGEYELMYRYQHQSNLSIGDRNPGVNFHMFSLGYHF